MKTPEDLYWERKKRANKGLTDPKARVTLTNAAFEKEIRKAHASGKAVGFKQGFEVGKLTKPTEATDPVMSFFDQFTQGEH
jgi:hypothetical protein